MTQLYHAAQSAFLKHGSAAFGSAQRAVFLPVTSLPGSIPRIVLPLFGIIAPSRLWLTEMAATAIRSGPMADRSPIVQLPPNPAAEDLATRYLQPVLPALMEASFETIAKLGPQELKERPECLVSSAGLSKCWDSISTVPRVMSIPGREGHSLLPDVPVVPYTPWEPFANTHTSKPFEVGLI